MKNSYPIFFRSILTEFNKYKKQLCIVFVACLVLFSAWGVLQLRKRSAEAVEAQEEITEYEAQLETYDQTLEEIETSLKLAEEQIAELQEYIDHSIYMKLDSQNIHSFNARYSVSSEANIGNILNAIAQFVNEGGMQAGVEEEHPDYESAYWRDVLSVAISGNNLNLTFYYYDEAKGQEIFDFIKTKLRNQLPAIAEKQGAFQLNEIDSVHTVKADVNVTNTQNNHRNNLKNYTSNHVDFENKMTSQKTAKKNYIEKNEPESYEKASVNPVSFLLKYMIVGALFGLVAPAAYFMLRNTLDLTVHSAEDLKSQGFFVLGEYSEAEGEKGLEALLLETKLLLKRNAYKAPFLSVLSEDKLESEMITSYVKGLSEAGISIMVNKKDQTRSDLFESLSDVDACIFLLQRNVSSYTVLKEQLALYEKLNIPVLGCVVLNT